MSFSTLLVYVRSFFPHLPWWHWILLLLVALAVMTVGLIGKRNSVYGAAILGVAVAMGMALLDALVLIRIGGQHKLHPDIDLAAEWQRLITGGEEVHILMLFNAVVFAPFGMALAEAFAAASSAKHQRSIALNQTNSGHPSKPTRAVRWKHIGYIAIIALLLSLTIETLQLKLHVGMFEVTDLILNTAGAVLGGVVVLVIWIAFNRNT